MNNDQQFQINDLSNELKLILVLLSGQDGIVVNVELQELLKIVDWDRFIELARHHRVFPSINRKLQDIRSTDVPAFVSTMFQRDYYRNTLLMLGLSGEMEQLAKSFSEHGIRSLFLKGPVIAADLYGDVSLRTSCDLDLLIPIGDLNQAEQLMLGMGYEKDDYIETVLGDWKWRHHHITFLHPEKRIKVELHWRLNPAPSSEPAFDELWNRRRKSALINRPIYYLGREDLFLFLVSHGARHGWSRLRWLLDIKQLVDQRVDWTALRKLLGKHRYQHIGGQALLLASRLFAVPLREEMRPLLAGRKAHWLAEDTMFYVHRLVNLHTDPVPEEVQRYHKRYLFSLLTNVQKVQFIASFLYPYPEDAATLPLPRPLHGLYFVLRPFLWLWRKYKSSMSKDNEMKRAGDNHEKRTDHFL